MLEALREFLKGPVFVFSISMAVLGVLRLAYLHIYLIVKALYNSWKYQKNHSMLIKGLLTSALPHKLIRFEMSVVSLFNVIVPVIIFFLHFFVLDHISLFEKSTGIALIAFSKSFADFLLLVIVIFIVTRIWRGIFKPDKSVGSGNNLWFWSFVLLVSISGWFAANINNAIMLKYMQVIHLLSGNILIVSIPFSRIGYYVIYPLAGITSHIGIWLLPDAPPRDETTPYFKCLMEKQ